MPTSENIDNNNGGDEDSLISCIKELEKELIKQKNMGPRKKVEDDEKSEVLEKVNSQIYTALRS
ncbi:hypothetical protein Glove_290g88 [Diversispora epigaea]|uniref:Uncharacterized protein n=1 Tax=Diversispora epigaea TaxID=1348612 RepID=A0A397I8E9_9GLOM|nr:hypothetical protein Glove_290g88 [Diversispora epigaea]